MPENSEIINLLREIRDVQQAHFARNQEYTAATVKRQEEASENQKAIAARSAQHREADQQFRQQVQENAMEVRRAQKKMMVINVVGAVLRAALIFVLVYFLIFWKR